MKSTLATILDTASNFVAKEFSLTLQKSKLQIYDTKVWNTFCIINGFNKESSGLYVPENFTAYAHHQTKHLIPTTFHELYGHGLFCEHSTIGKELVYIETNKENSRQYLNKKLNKKNYSFGICTTKMDIYEGFAMWMEELLCKETQNKTAWTKKNPAIPKYYLNLLNSFKNEEVKLGRVNLVDKLGFKI